MIVYCIYFDQGRLGAGAGNVWKLPVLLVQNSIDLLLTSFGLWDTVYLDILSSVYFRITFGTTTHHLLLSTAPGLTWTSGIGPFPELWSNILCYPSHTAVQQQSALSSTSRSTVTGSTTSRSLPVDSSIRESMFIHGWLQPSTSLPWWQTLTPPKKIRPKLDTQTTVSLSTRPTFRCLTSLKCKRMCWTTFIIN